MRVSIADAKNKLTQLIFAVERGEPVTICRHGQPVIDLVPSKQASIEPRKFGTLKGRAKIIDPNWHKAVETPEELQKWMAGEY